MKDEVSHPFFIENYSNSCYSFHVISFFHFLITFFFFLFFYWAVRSGDSSENHLYWVFFCFYKEI